MNELGTHNWIRQGWQTAVAWLACLLFMLFAIRPVAAQSNEFAPATATLLREGDLDARVPGWKTIGVKAGDTLVKNDFLSAVILTGSRDSKSMRVGQCIVLDGLFDGGREPVVIGPGPRGIWKRAELQRNGTAILARFRHEGDDWSAQLVYRIDGANPWLEILTTVTNRSKDRTLEIPIVDDLRTPEKSKVADNVIEAITVSRDNPAWVVTMAATTQKAFVSESDESRWFVAYNSGDPTPSVLKRIRPKLLPLIRSNEMFQPLTVERDWTKAVKDREHWFRIEPQSQREIVRCVLFSPTMHEAKSLTAFVRDQKKSTLVASDSATSKKSAATKPTGKTGRFASSSAKPPTPTGESPSLPRRIIGTLRGKSTESTKTAAEAEPSPFVPKKASNPDAPQWRPDTKSKVDKPTADTKSVEPPPSILNIQKLPPPIDDGM